MDSKLVEERSKLTCLKVGIGVGGPPFDRTATGDQGSKSGRKRVPSDLIIGTPNYGNHHTHNPKLA